MRFLTYKFVFVQQQKLLTVDIRKYGIEKVCTESTVMINDLILIPVYETIK